MANDSPERSWNCGSVPRIASCLKSLNGRVTEVNREDASRPKNQTAIPHTDWHILCPVNVWDSVTHFLPP